MDNFYNKNIMIIGGGCGLGRDMAVEFAKNRSNIFLVHNNREELSDAEQNISNMRVRVYSYKCDFSDVRDIDKLFKIYKQNFDSVDVLVNALEPKQKDLFFNYSPEEIREIINLELLSLTHIISSAYKEMVERKKGVVLNIESVDYNQTDNILGGICSNGLLAITEGINKFAKQTKNKELYSTFVYRSFKNYYSVDNSDKIMKALIKKKEFMRL